MATKELALKIVRDLAHRMQEQYEEWTGADARSIGCVRYAYERIFQFKSSYEREVDPEGSSWLVLKLSLESYTIAKHESEFLAKLAHVDIIYLTFFSTLAELLLMCGWDKTSIHQYFEQHATEVLTNADTDVIAKLQMPSMVGHGSSPNP